MRWCKVAQLSPSFILLCGADVAQPALKMFHRKRELRIFSRNSLISLVPEAGLEPAQRYTPRDFKSLVSTNSTTRA